MNFAPVEFFHNCLPVRELSCLNEMIMSSKSKELGKTTLIAGEFHAKTTTQTDRAADINYRTMSIGDRLSN